MGEPLENARSGHDVECPLKREGLDVGDLEREAGDVAVRAARLFDQPGINIDADDAAPRRHGFGDAARNSSRATAGVEHGQSGSEQARQVPVGGGKGPPVKKRAGSRRHVRTLPCNIIRALQTIAPLYHAA
jgi:hypothetical protein